MSRTLLSLAGFQVILIGRFWVIAEDPGGTFRTAYVKTNLSLDDYLESLLDSRYADIPEGGMPAYRTRCDACGEVGPLFPDEHDPFRHKTGCPQGTFRL